MHLLVQFYEIVVDFE